VAKRYTVQQKCLRKWIGSALLGTRRYNLQSPTPTLSATAHSLTDRQTDIRQCHANNRSYYMQQYDRLKTNTTSLIMTQVVIWEIVWKPAAGTNVDRATLNAGQNPPPGYRTSLITMGSCSVTCQASTRHKWIHPALTPARQTGTWFSVRAYKIIIFGVL